MNILYAFSYFQRIAVPGTIFNELQSELALPSTAVALLGGLYLYVYGGMQIFSGMFVDRFGSVRIILSGGVLLAIGSILFPMSHSLAMLYITRVIIGLGASLMFLSLIKEIDSKFSGKNFSALLSSTLFAGYLGGLLGTRPFESAVGAFGWRSSLLAVGITCGIFVILSAVLMWHSRNGNHIKSAASVLLALKQVTRNWSCYPGVYTGTVMFGNYFIMQAIIGKKFLQDCAGFSSASAASLTFLMMLVSMSASIFAGILPRWIENRRKPILIASSIATVIAPVLALLVISGGRMWVLPCYIMFGISTAGSPIFSTVMKELNEPNFAASSIGVSNCIGYVSIAVLTTAIGRALDLFSSQAVRTSAIIQYPPAAYRVIFIGFTILAISALISCLFVRETYGRNIYLEKAESR